MTIAHCTLADVGEVTGTLIVIDVLRAFTTAAVALSQGPASYELVSTVEQARARRAADPDVLLVGEVDGRPVEEFDHSNSPVEMADAAVTGRQVVHRSSAGTQGVVGAAMADRVLAASFVVARATALAVQRDDRVTFCLTGADDARDGDEDRACADYISALLTTGWVNPRDYLDRVPRSTAGTHFADPAQPWMRPEDVAAACAVDRYAFTMPARHDAEERWWLDAVIPG